MTTYDDETVDFAYEMIRRYSNNGNVSPKLIEMAQNYIDGIDMWLIDLLEDNIELYDDEEVEDFVNPEGIAMIILEEAAKQ